MEIGKYIDHTNLKMSATENDIAKLCHEAIEYGFETVCVNPYYVTLAKDLLKDTNIGVCTVVGFPLGMNTPKVKSYEAIEAIEKYLDLESWQISAIQKGIKDIDNGKHVSIDDVKKEWGIE